jgi:hypothetical protein
MIPQAPCRHFHKHGALLFAASLVTPAAAAGPRQQLPPILGGPATSAEAAAPIDPSLPTGAPYEPGSRPERRQIACSARRPVCLHALSGVTDKDALAALDAVERAYEALVDALGLPAPLSPLDVFLSSDLGEPVQVEYDPPALTGFDRATAFCRLRPAREPLLARAATLCVGEAIALALDPGETPHLRRAFATALWWIVGTPTVLDLEAVAELELRPERAVLRQARDQNSEGAALFFEYLEATRGVAEPGVLAAALFAASGQRTSFDEPEWDNEPDLVDVLRHTFARDRLRTIALYRDFCVARAFIGARDDGQHLPGLAWAGAFAEPRFDWVIPFSSLPRRVLLTRPIEPGGAVFVRLELDQPAPGATLGFRAEWEGPVSFAWTLVRVGEGGNELSRIDLPFQERSTLAEGRVDDLHGVRAINLVGTFLDEVTLAHPFDPDVEPFEAHSATIYFARL